MSNNLKRWIYLVEKDKQKRNLLLVLLFGIISFFIIFNIFPDIKNNNKELYKLNWMLDLIKKNDVYLKIVDWHYNIDTITSKINQSKSNLLYSWDPSNYLYIEKYTSTILQKYWYEDFKFWDKYTFVNKWSNSVKIDLVFTNKKSLIDLINEFNNDWYLWRTVIQKEWLLYKTKLELTFNIN